MWKNLTMPWPAVGASVVFTAVVLGGYAYYVHSVVIPAEDLAEQQRALAVQARDMAVQRDVEAAGNAILNTMALMQATEAMTPMPVANSAPGPTAATADGEPGPVVQTTAQPAPAFAPAAPQGYFYANSAPAPAAPPIYTPPPVPEPAAGPAESPGIVTINVTPPPPLVETSPQVLTAGFYWAPGYWSYNQGRFNWNRGQVKPTPAAYISSSSRYVPTQWVTRNGAYVLVPGYWVNAPANSIPSNTLPGAAPLIQLPTATFSHPAPSRPGGG
jgi:hypothetical protein